MPSRVFGALTSSVTVKLLTSGAGSLLMISSYSADHGDTRFPVPLAFARNTIRLPASSGIGTSTLPTLASISGALIHTLDSPSGLPGSVSMTPVIGSSTMSESILYCRRYERVTVASRSGFSTDTLTTADK